MKDIVEYSMRLDDGTHILVQAPGREVAATAFEFLRELVTAEESEPPQFKLIGQR